MVLKKYIKYAFLAVGLFSKLRRFAADFPIKPIPGTGWYAVPKDLNIDHDYIYDDCDDCDEHDLDPITEPTLQIKRSLNSSQVCNLGFHIETNHNSYLPECVKNECKCNHGTAAEGINCTKHDSIICNPLTCASGYHFEHSDFNEHEIYCKENVCECPHGIPERYESCPEHGMVACKRCTEIGFRGEMKKRIWNKEGVYQCVEDDRALNVCEIPDCKHLLSKCVDKNDCDCEKLKKCKNKEKPAKTVNGRDEFLCKKGWLEYGGESGHKRYLSKKRARRVLENGKKECCNKENSVKEPKSIISDHYLDSYDQNRYEELNHEYDY